MLIRAKTDIYCEGVGLVKKGKEASCKNAETLVSIGAAEKISEPQEPQQPQENDIVFMLTQLKGVGKSTAEKIAEKGVSSLQDLLDRIEEEEISSSFPNENAKNTAIQSAKEFI